jgi:hypothetical protein
VREEKENPPLVWNSGKGFSIDREAGKSHIFKVYSYHSWFGVAMVTEGLQGGL